MSPLAYWGLEGLSNICQTVLAPSLIKVRLLTATYLLCIYISCCRLAEQRISAEKIQKTVWHKYCSKFVCVCGLSTYIRNLCVNY